jgi:hypothetical protein
MEDTATKVSVEVVVEKLLSKEVKHKNSRNPIVISEEYRKSIGFLSELSGCEMSQIVNNVLSLCFGNPEIQKLLNAFAKNKCKERLEVLMK